MAVAVGSATIGGLPSNNVPSASVPGSVGLPPSASIISPGLPSSLSEPNTQTATAVPVTNPAVDVPSAAAPSIAAASPAVSLPAAAAIAPASNPAAATPDPGQIAPSNSPISTPPVTGAAVPSSSPISSPPVTGAAVPSGPVGVTATATSTATSTATATATAAPATSDSPVPSVISTLSFPDRPEAASYVQEIFGPYPYDLAAFMADNASLYPNDLSAMSSALPELILNHPSSSIGPNATTGVLIAADFALSCNGLDTSQPFLDGACNNLNTPWWGQVGVQYQRIGRAVYPGDGSGATFRTWLNPRRASNILFAQDDNEQIFDERGLSNWVVEFGQFVSNTRTQTRTGRRQKRELRSHSTLTSRSFLPVSRFACGHFSVFFRVCVC